MAFAQELGNGLTCVKDETRPNALMALSTFCTTAGISTALRPLDAMGYRGAPSSSGRVLVEDGPAMTSAAGPASAWPSSLSEDSDMAARLGYCKRNMNNETEET